MFPNFRFWSTTPQEDETRLVNYTPYTAKSRRNRTAPYPIRPSPSVDGHHDIQKPLRPVSISQFSCAMPNLQL